MKQFITSDLHLGHANIIKYCNRPFSNLEQMNETLIRNWNTRVKPEDFIYIVGDFCFKNTSNKGEGIKIKAQEWIEKLNGNKIFLQGNHDKGNSLHTVCIGLLLEYMNHKIWCVHKPEHANLNYYINFVGHVHQNWVIKKYKNTILFNVGVDVHRFMPITIEEALKKISFLNKSKIEEYVPYVKL